METFGTRRIVRIGVTAALYAVLTIVLSSFSYYGIQFRISEALMLLCLLSKDYVAATTIGCFVANIYSPVGMIDLVVGTAATFLSGLCIYLLRKRLNPVTASIFPVAFNAVFVGLELYFAMHEPLLITMGTVALGEVVCVTLAGPLLYKAITSNAAVMRMMTDGESDDREKEREKN